MPPRPTGTNPQDCWRARGDKVKGISVDGSLVIQVSLVGCDRLNVEYTTSRQRRLEDVSPAGTRNKSKALPKSRRRSSVCVQNIIRHVFRLVSDGNYSVLVIYVSFRVALYSNSKVRTLPLLFTSRGNQWSAISPTPSWRHALHLPAPA